MTELGITSGKTPSVDVEQALVALQLFGRPWLFVSISGDWRCKVDMHVVAAGASFEIQSDPLKTPSLAVLQCWQRINAALQIYKEI